MKRLFLFLPIVIVVALGCDLAVTVAPPTGPAALPTPTMSASALSPDAPVTETPASATALPTIFAPDPTATVQQPPFQGAEVFYGPLKLILPPGLASGVSGNQFPRSEGADVAPWGVSPGHTQLNLEGYLLQGKFHQPQIYVYPALSYAEMSPAAFESMHRLRNLLYDPDAAVSNEHFPLVPFFSAGQVFASNIQMISFQNGQGVRFLTEYAQYAAPVNNHELFYHFQGFTSDGEYYFVAILPVTAPVLPETNDGGAALPQGGVPYPDITDPNADWGGYYSAVSALLNNTPQESFAPALTQLDKLIQSMQITP